MGGGCVGRAGRHTSGGQDCKVGVCSVWSGTAVPLLLPMLLLVPQVDKILKVVPRERVTSLYSATMTSKVQKLQRAALKNPVRVEVSSK